MKRILCALLASLLLFAALVVASADPFFDEGVRAITGNEYGNRVHYAQIGDWTVSLGYMVEEERYCVIGQGPDGARAALTDRMPGNGKIVPAGDGFIYYGEDQNGKHNWVFRKPGEEPKKLELGITDEVFFADAEYIWYYTHVGAEISIRRLTRKGNAKKGFGRTTGFVYAMMESGDALVADLHKNRVQTWKDGRGTTLYEPEAPILSISTVGRSVWVGHEHEIGLLENGALDFRLPGYVAGMAGTTDQFVLLLSFPEGTDYEVLLLNDVYQAYARLGYVLASESAFIELQSDGDITVWGPEQSVTFVIPPAEAWIPYGFYEPGG